MKVMKPVIAVDCDEVLCYFNESLMNFHNEFYNTTLTIEDFSNFQLHMVWGGTQEDTNKKFVQFYQTLHFQNLKPVPGAFESLKKLTKNYSLVVVTARDHHLWDHTKKYLDTHYPDIFDDLLHGNHYGQGLKITKHDLCKKVGALMLIDDNVGYINEVTSRGLQGIVFGKYPWNQDHKISHDLVKRVESWHEIDVDFISSILK